MIANLVSALTGNAALFTFTASAGDLEVVRFAGFEAVSSLFELRIELAGPEIDLAALVDKPALLTIGGVESPRQIHGLVCGAEYSGELRQHHIYEVTFVPRVWRLTRRQDSRIFQRKTTQTIVGEVLEKAGIPRDWFRFDLFSSYNPRDYCVQYRESDWDFVSRLLEEDGIYYYFEHSAEKHVLVMSDKPGAPAIAGPQEVWWAPPHGFVRGQEHITRFRLLEGVRTGKSALRDHNLHKPDQQMDASESAQLATDLEVYDFPGEYQVSGGRSSDQGAGLAKIRLEAMQHDRRRGLGESDCPRLVPGYSFTQAGHQRGDLDGDYKLLRVEHKGEQSQVLEQDAGTEFSYNNSFVCIEAKTPYRPPRVTPRPAVRGVQTATVVGPPNEEIYVDEHARVKVQFHWDRSDKFSEDSSCWVRVSQLWAGNSWGAMFIPRIGHEVLVDFIEGDPDRPVIVGRIYHGLNLPPYPLPEQKTKSTIKSDTYQGAGYNELRFEDQKGIEQIFMHAQRNMDIRVLHDRMESVLHNRHLTVGSNDGGAKIGDYYENIWRDHHWRIDRNRNEHVGGDLRIRVGGIDGVGHVDTIIEGNRRELVMQSQSLEIKADLKIKIGGGHHEQVLGDVHRKVTGLLSVEALKEVHYKSSKVVIEASQGLTVRGPGGFITIHAGGIDIVGTLVKINSGGSALTGTAAGPQNPDEAKPVEPTKPDPADSGGI
ncbi:type VI secretion system tip protein TssI/VgrG [Nannocystis sp. ILAH1]|uniref:type VI secretion system Vgr family protein n=1 Tax=unclassified Nannocystis TaxID=2627009 RepID=UPI00227055E4|nr:MULTISPECIES: type VI secretion system tip protein TssI/VgrG [unclassified Nannocystis]MCY0993484.1 type VI secretion system tip protein TssI/VgrG [Nannocystis sp. ILAH1]MCY1063788.1 type VI secretion system tip protein TssI/VgrG [Nannocystis sp. RBIL2]